MSLFRRKTKYDYKTDFLPQGGKFRHLDRIADLNKVVVREPKMDESTVVFLPYPKFEDANYKARRLVEDDLLDPLDSRSLGPWLFPAEGVRYFGKNPVSLLFDNPDESGFIPTEHHPIYMIYDTVLRTVKSKSVVNTPIGSSVTDRWEIFLNGDKEAQGNNFGCLNRPGPLTLAYVLAYTLGKDQPFAQTGYPLGGMAGDKPVIFMMTQTVTRTLLEAFDSYLENEQHPKILTGGLAVHFYDRQKGVCSAKAAEAASASLQLGGSRRAPAANQQQVQLAGYGVHLTQTLSGRHGDPLLPRDMFIDQAVKTIRPWEEVLRGHTPEQCAKIVADQCGLPMSMLYHAWKSMPEYYSDEMRTAIRNPVSQNFGNRNSVPQSRDQENPTYSPQTTSNPFGLGGYTPPTAADEGDGPVGGDTPPVEKGDFVASDLGYDPAEEERLDAEFRKRFQTATQTPRTPSAGPAAGGANVRR